jgi:hypothetical protein
MFELVQEALDQPPLHIYPAAHVLDDAFCLPESIYLG